MTSFNSALGRHEIQSGSLLYGGYFDRLKDALGWVRILLWGATLFTALSGFTPMLFIGYWSSGLLGLKAALVWGLVGGFVLQLMCFVDRGLIGCQRGLVESALEAQSVTSGDPGLYKVYVDLHWREWWRQTLHRGLALLIIMGILTMGLGVGANIIVEVSHSFGQYNVVSWLTWYLAVGLLLQGVKFGVEKLLSLFAEMQERVDPKLEVEKVKGLQEVRWCKAMVKYVESQNYQQQGIRGYKNIPIMDGYWGSGQDEDAGSWKVTAVRKPCGRANL